MAELKVFGRYDYYSKETIIEFVKNFLSCQTTVVVENEWFDVDPLILIDQEIFMQKRENWSEEATRQIILEAFEEAKKNPKKYLKKFRTIFPAKESLWTCYTEQECEEISLQLGDHQADWIEQAFEWAQRIFNNNVIGWKTVCNKRDTAKFYRIVKWKDNNIKCVGGSNITSVDGAVFPAAVRDFEKETRKNHATPLVVGYDFSIDNITENTEKMFFQVNGDERYFSKVEIETIIEYVKDAKKVPFENEWFEVNPIEIDKNFFKNRSKIASEDMEIELFDWINRALAEVEKYPDRYAKPFKVMFPSRMWEISTENCEKIACEIGDHQADWVEQGLQWAQQIMNYNYFYETLLESFSDTANWYRLIKGNCYGNKDCITQVGGSLIEKEDRNFCLPTISTSRADGIQKYGVPSIVSYDS